MEIKKTMRTLKIIVLRMQIWWTNIYFDIRYPVQFTNPVTWLRVYAIYLKSVHHLTDRLKALRNE